MSKVPKKYRVPKDSHKPKKIKCVACNGSGYYDHYYYPTGSPRCSSCNGTGYDKIEMPL